MLWRIIMERVKFDGKQWYKVSVANRVISPFPCFYGLRLFNDKACSFFHNLCPDKGWVRACVTLRSTQLTFSPIWKAHVERMKHSRNSCYNWCKAKRNSRETEFSWNDETICDQIYVHKNEAMYTMLYLKQLEKNELNAKAQQKFEPDSSPTIRA